MIMTLINKALDSKALSLIGRVLLCSAFLQSLYDKANFQHAMGEMAHFNLQPAAVFAAATIAVQLIGMILIIWGRYAWFGAGALGIFTALTLPIAHNFWDLTGPERMNQVFFFYEHVSVIGGLILAAILCRREGKPT